MEGSSILKVFGFPFEVAVESRFGVVFGRFWVQKSTQQTSKMDQKNGLKIRCENGQGKELQKWPEPHRREIREGWGIHLSPAEAPGPPPLVMIYYRVENKKNRYEI